MGRGSAALGNVTAMPALYTATDQLMSQHHDGAKPFTHCIHICHMLHAVAVAGTCAVPHSSVAASSTHAAAAAAPRTGAPKSATSASVMPLAIAHHLPAAGLQHAITPRRRACMG